SKNDCDPKRTSSPTVQRHGGGVRVSRAESPLRGRMIFNVGSRRSGTFWLQRIVTAHPEVSAVGSETHLFSHGIAPLAERFHHAALGSGQVGSTFIERDA